MTKDTALRNKVPLALQIAILSVPFLMMGGTAVGAGLATIKAAFPDAAISTINLIQTAPSLTTFPFALLAGIIAGRSKITYRRLVLVAIAVFTIGGVAGTIFIDNLNALIASRFVFGIGAGLVFPCGQMLVYHYISDKKKHPRYLANNNVMNNLGGVLFQYAGGVIAMFNYRLIFLVYLLGVVSFICVYVGLRKAPETDEAAQEGSGEIVKEEKTKQLSFVESIKVIPLVLWVLLLCFGLFIVFKTPGTMLMSYYIADNGGTPIDTANILTVFTVTGICVSLIFPGVFRIFGRFTVFIGLLCQVCAFIVMYFGGIIGCYIGMFLAGCSLAFAMPGLQELISCLCPKGADSLTSGIMMMLMNLGMFVGGFWAAFAKNLAGADNVYLAWLFSAIAIGVLAVFLFIVAFKDRPEYHTARKEK